MSRQGEPTRTRHRIPSINCRLVHFGGRPGFFPTGSNRFQHRPLRVGQVGSSRRRYAGHEVSGVLDQLGR
jgi:hypothetical protein